MSVSHADAAADLFQSHRDELGFVNRAQCREKDLVTVEVAGTVAGALLGNHCVRKPQSTIYEVAVRQKYRREGIASTLVERFAAESPHDRLVAKCPTDLPANEFYRATGWECIDTEDGKKRDLNVWEKDTSDRVQVYMTVNGGTETAQAIQQSAAKAGVEASNGWPLDDSPAFVDYPFSDPEATFDDHLAAVREHEPELTVAPDVECGRGLSDVVDMADQLETHAETVIIVPKDCHPSEIPDRHRVGLTAGRFGSMSPWSAWEYRDAGSVHILGGSPNEQHAVAEHVDVASTDSYSLGRRAQFGLWDDGAHDAPDWMDYYHRLTRSLDNFSKELNHDRKR